MNRRRNGIRKTWASPKGVTFQIVRKWLRELPPGLDSGLDREEALELISRINRYCQLYLREYGTRIFLLDRIRRARELPRQKGGGKWPFCPDAIDCHPAGCHVCWKEYAQAQGESFFRETRDGDDIFNKESLK